MTEKALKLGDSRRLTGPNLFGSKAAAVMDVLIGGYDHQQVTDRWQAELKLLLQPLGWSNQSIFCRNYQAGASLGFTAPIDVLYAATEVNEAAWQRVVNHFTDASQNPIEDEVHRLQKEIAAEANPALIALYQAAKTHDVRFLSDDDFVSLGYGVSCQVFAVDQLPAIDQIDWSAIQSIPLALVTGTNGKSTTVRLASHVIKAAGMKCGITSTDYIRIDDEILDTGDYSGPGGARTLLRHPDTEVALLEVARGGMLRRGLGVNQAHCAAITNVAADHLGDYGMDTVSDMVAAKFVVRQALNAQQDLILNADDEGVVEFAQDLDNEIVWFSWDADSPSIEKHLKQGGKKGQGGKAVYVKHGMVYYQNGKQTATPVIAVNEIPITMNGAAKHNTHNALVVVAMMFSMQIELSAIQTGLRTFDSSPENNPGRGNLFKVKDFQVLVDFAHNEHGLAAMADTLKSMPANRRLVLLGQAGDRDDKLIKGLVNSALLADPDCLVVCEMEEYLRGRQLGEIPNLITHHAIENGMQVNQIMTAASPLEGTKMALSWAQAGDVLLILSLTEREQVIELIQNYQ
ncbi:Cyanophycin synthase [hydrothermal vent metagenome]|uniref:Cyanophycin synthase n=1 Tax=hydrothermal vent metagenome TaxID=652676 RepID=A0A3B0W0V7_9ZZZZ